MLARPAPAVIFAVSFLGVGVNSPILPALPEIVRHFDASPSAAGFVIAAASLPGMVMAPVAGALMDRFGRREVLLPLLAVFAAAGIAAALAPTFVFLLAMRAFQGIGSAALINGAVVLIGDFWSAAERPRVLGRNAAVMTFGLTVYPLLGGLLTRFGGWRAPFLLTLAAIPLARWIVRAVPAGVRRTGTRPWRLRDSIAAVRRRNILTALGATLVMHLLLFGAVYTVLPLYVDAELALGPVARGIVLTLPALTATGAALLLGRLRERRASQSVLGGSFGAFAAALMVLSMEPSLMIVVAGAAVFGVGLGLATPALQDEVVTGAKSGNRGMIVAIWAMSVRGGQTLGPLMAAALLATGGAGIVFFLGAAVAVVPSLGYLLSWPIVSRQSAEDPD